MRSSVALDVVHSNIFVPFDVSSLEGNKYFICFVDEYTMNMWLYTIKLKSKALEVVKQFEILVEKQSGRGKYTSKDFEKFCKNHMVLCMRPQHLIYHNIMGL